MFIEKSKAGVLLSVLLVMIAAAGAATTYLAEEIDGQLVYGTYANQGQANAVNKIPDFSRAGYMGGGAAIPFIPTVIELTPSGGDDTAAIQTALDQMISIAPMNENGFRGAVLLRAGTYYVSDSLYMNESGVILRGEGSDEVGGSKIIFTATTQKNMIVVGSNGSINNNSSAMQITDSFVPVGANSFMVSNASGYNVGNEIIVENTFNQQWIDDLDMAQYGWTTSGYQLRNPRVITAKYGNYIILDTPLVQTIEDRYGGGRIYKYSYNNYVQNVGLEGLRLESTYTSDTDENHGWSAIKFEHVKDFWVRQVTAVYFGYSCVQVGDWSMFGTVEDCAMLDYKSVITGGRRYGFVIDDSCFVLFHRCYTRQGRHDYATGSRTPGPNAFVDSRADYTHADIGPHHRWAMGLLFDNILGGAMAVQNRQASGSGHGWSGAQTMFWNCDSSQMICDGPTGAMNWSVGCKGTKAEGSWNPLEPFGIWESHGTHVTPRSLYYTQLRDRLGWNAVQNVIIPRQADGDVWDELLSWAGNGLFGEGVVAWQTGGEFPDVGVKAVVRNLNMLENGITVTWSKLSGPADVTFANPTALETTATFSKAGDYVLEILIDDGVSQVSNTLNISARAGGDLSGDGKVDMEDMAELSCQWQTVYDMTNLLNVAEDWLFGTDDNAPDDSLVEIENFQGYAAGLGIDDALTFGGGGTWDTHGNGTIAVKTKDDAGSMALRIQSATGGSARAAGIQSIDDTVAPGESAVAFFRMKISTNSTNGDDDTLFTNLFMGFHDSTGEDAIAADHKFRSSIVAGFGLVDTKGDPSGDALDIITTNQTPVVLGQIQQAQWYDVWIVMNNASDTFDLHIRQSAGRGTDSPGLPDSGGADALAIGLTFGKTPQIDPEGLVWIQEDDGVDNGRNIDLYIDDVYWDGSFQK